MPQLAKTYTAPAEVRFNSTELGVPSDINDIQSLARRNVGAALNAALNPTGVQLRTFSDALDIGTTGTDLVLTVKGLAPILWELSPDPGPPDPQVLLHLLGADDTFTADAADPTNPRIDIFSAKLETGDLGDPEARVVKDAGTGLITSQPSVNKRSRTKLTVTYTPGTPAVSPVAPTPPAGEVVFAEVAVAALATVLNASDVTDLRSRYEHVSDSISIVAMDPFDLTVSPTGVNASYFEAITLPIGAKITEVRVRLTPLFAGNVLSANLERRTEGSSANHGSAVSTGEAWQTLTITPNPEAIVGLNDAFYVDVNKDAEGGTATCVVGWTEIDFERDRG